MEIENRIKELRYIPASELRANPKNWRKHPTQQQKMLRTMFNEVGYIDALIGRDVDDGSVELIDGHLRKEMSGHQDVPVLVLDVTEAEADLILASFDPITGMADTDKATLKDLLQGIDSEEDQISEMLDKLAKDSNIDLYDEQPEPEARIEIADELQAKWQTELGQLWQIGKHRVLCGDCTDEKLAERLMDGKKADMVFTDPPYGVGYQDVKGRHDKIKGDDSLLNVNKLLENVLINSCPLFICCNWRSYSTFEGAMIASGRTPKACIVWDKGVGVQNLDKYYKQHEFILYNGLFGGQKTLRGDVWNIKRSVSSDHPTSKPVELVSISILDTILINGIVQDLFLGSHSTMVAAEQTGRICYGMELEPKYVAVGLERMDEMGLKPELIDV